MKINNLSITSLSALNFEIAPAKPVCILRGHNSDLALDLIRELIGDFEAEEDPDRAGDGRFIIHSDVELDGKSYSVCYIRNADYIGDNRIAVNFEPNSIRFSEDDTNEFIEKRRKRNKDTSNILLGISDYEVGEDDRPLFIYQLDREDEARIVPFLERMTNIGRQVFIAVCNSFPDIEHNNIHTLTLN